VQTKAAAISDFLKINSSLLFPAFQPEDSPIRTDAFGAHLDPASRGTHAGDAAARRARLTQSLGERGRRVLEEREETRAGEERSSRQRENSEQRERIGRRENRQRAGGFAMTGSKQRYHAKVSPGRVAMEMFVQRRRDTKQTRREKRDGDDRGETKSA
jgi:hypothetical protein